MFNLEIDTKILYLCGKVTKNVFVKNKTFLYLFSQMRKGISSRVSARSTVSALSQASTKTAPVKGARPYRKFHYILKEYGKFGMDTPKWTISGRIEQKPPTNNFPGPGEYEIPDSIYENKKGHLIESRPDEHFESLTSKLDYDVKTSILPPNPIKIGKITGPSYIGKTNSPDFTYVPPPFGSETTVKILERHEEKVDNGVPGPGKYNPTDINRHIPTFSMAKHHIPSNNKKKDVDNSPGPGTYNLTDPLPPIGRWSDKYREKPHRRRSQVNRLCPWEKPKPVLNI